MVLIEKEVKNVYLGEYTWPTYTTTVACDFRAWASWETTTINQILSNDWIIYNNSSAISAWSNWRLRLSIPSTDRSATICLWWWYSSSSWNCTNWGFAKPSTWQDWRMQNLIKKAYLRIAYIYATNTQSSYWYWYWVFSPRWPSVVFNKKLVSTNWRWYDGWTTYLSKGWFVFRNSDGGWASAYTAWPTDSNTQYLALPSHPNTWIWVTSTSYINQWQNCQYSRLTLETRWTDPSDFHYRLIVWLTWNEYDLWLCSDLWPANVEVTSGDWYCAGSYKELDEAYIEYYNELYIVSDWTITTTKPR